MQVQCSEAGSSCTPTPHLSLVSLTPSTSYLTPLPCSSVSCVSQVGRPKASTALTIPTVSGGHSRDLDTSPGVHCWGDFPGPTLPRILRTPTRRGYRQDCPCLLPTPNSGGCRGSHLLKVTAWRKAGRNAHHVGKKAKFEASHWVSSWTKTGRGGEEKRR